MKMTQNEFVCWMFLLLGEKVNLKNTDVSHIHVSILLLCP